MQHQIVVSPNSMTLDDLGNNQQHFGEVNCPFCNHSNILATNKGGGVAYAFNPCRHNLGAIQGARNDSTFIFKRYR